MSIGELLNAHIAAQQSVELADRSGDLSWRMLSRVTLAYAEHQSGHPAEAEIAFRAAETLQKEFQPSYPQLYALQGFRYCNFLLEQGQLQEVRIRAAQTLEWAKQQLGPLPIALDNLSLGCAYLLSMDVDAHATAAPFLHRAVEGLREAGQLDELPRGLLACAALYRLMGNHHLAHRDVNEALQIAMRGSMSLHLADCHLESSRLALATGDRDSARKAWATAQKMIEEMGYHRRDSEVRELAAQLGVELQDG